jgi:CubicO group peptidase (beta-lactamase class C family)
MWLRRALSRFVVVWFCLPCVLGGVAPAFAKSSVQSTLEAWRTRNPGSVVSIAVVSGVGVVFASSSAAMTEHSTVVIGSAAKSLVSLAAMRLVDEGRLNLDASVLPLVPELRSWNGYGGRVTMRHLLTHDAGFPAFLPVPHAGFTTVEAAVTELANGPWDMPGRAVGLYSNAGYVVAGLVIERLSGLSLEAYLTRFVLEPLGVRDGGFLDSAFAPIVAPRGTLNLLGSWSLPTLFTRVYAAASGTLALSAADAVGYVKWLVNSGGPAGVLTPTSRAEWLRVQKQVLVHSGVVAWEGKVSEYALGWFSGVRGGVRSWWHPGNTGTSSSFVGFSPERGVGVVVLCDADRAKAVEELGLALLDAARADATR